MERDFCCVITASGCEECCVYAEVPINRKLEVFRETVNVTRYNLVTVITIPGPLVLLCMMCYVYDVLC